MPIDDKLVFTEALQEEPRPESIVQAKAAEEKEEPAKLLNFLNSLTKFEKELMPKLLAAFLIRIEAKALLEIFKSLKKDMRLKFFYALSDFFNPDDINNVKQISTFLCSLIQDIQQPEHDPFCCEIIKDLTIHRLFFNCAYTLGQFESDSLKSSLLYLFLAHLGNVHAQYNYALRRLFGYGGLPTDRDEANKWFERAGLGGFQKILEDPSLLTTRYKVEIKKTRTEAKKTASFEFKLPKNQVEQNPSEKKQAAPFLINWGNSKINGDALYLFALVSKDNARNIVQEPELCKQLTNRQFIRLLEYFKEEPDAIVNLVKINLSRLEQAELAVIGQYHAKVAAWIKTDCTIKLTDDNLSMMLSPFPSLASEFWGEIWERGDLSNHCLLNLALSSADLASEIYDICGKQFFAEELGKIGETHLEFAQKIAGMILTNWGKEQYSDKFVIATLSYWVDKLKIAQLIVNHSGFQNALLTKQAVALEIISDIGVFYPKLILSHLPLLTTAQLQKLLHHFDIAAIALTNPALIKHLNDSGFITEIALLHPTLGKYVLKNFGKKLSPQQLVRLGQAHNELATFIIDQYDLRQKLNEWQIWQICKRNISLKYKVLQYGLATNVFDYVLDWEMARKMVSHPNFYHKITDYGLFLLCSRYSAIGYLLYSLPEVERKNVLQRLSIEQQADLAAKNLYIANFYYDKTTIFKDFTDIQTANILSQHLDLLYKLAQESDLHPRIFKFGEAAIKVLCSGSVIFAFRVFYSHGSYYNKLFNSLSYESFSEICAEHRSLAIRFFKILPIKIYQYIN